MIVMALSILMMSRNLKEDAASWPSFFAYVLLFLSIGLIVETFYKSKKTVAGENGQVKKETIKFVEKNLVYTVLSSVLYLLIMEHIGFLIVTPFYLAFLLWLLQYRSVKNLFLLSVGSTVFIILVFEYLLGVPIPQGILENFI